MLDTTTLDTSTLDTSTYGTTTACRGTLMLGRRLPLNVEHVKVRESLQEELRHGFCPLKLTRKNPSRTDAH